MERKKWSVGPDSLSPSKYTARLLLPCPPSLLTEGARTTADKSSSDDT